MTNIVHISVICEIKSLSRREPVELRVSSLHPPRELIERLCTQNLCQTNLAGRALCDLRIKIARQTARVVRGHLSHRPDSDRSIFEWSIEETATPCSAEYRHFETWDEFCDSGDFHAEDFCRHRDVDLFAIAAETRHRVEERGF